LIHFVKMKDALNNEIILGNKYGYSRNKNGFTYVRIGKLIKETPKGLVTMDVQISKYAMYSGHLIDESEAPKKISIKSNMLFPINN